MAVQRDRRDHAQQRGYVGELDIRTHRSRRRGFGERRPEHPDEARAQRCAMGGIVHEPFECRVDRRTFAEMMFDQFEQVEEATVPRLAGNCPIECVEIGLEQGCEQGIAVRKIPVERRAAHPGLARDGIERRVDAVARKDAPGRGQDRLAIAHAVAPVRQGGLGEIAIHPAETDTHVRLFRRTGKIVTQPCPVHG